MPRGLQHISRLRRRPRLSAAGALVLAYLLVMFPIGCGRMLADRLMLSPSRDPIRAPGASERFIETPVGRMHVIAARSAPPPQATPSQTGADVLAQRARAADIPPQRFVLRFEGNASRAEYSATYLAQRWDDVPTEVWSMNHPGFGKSQGPAALNKLAPAALAVYDALCAEAGDRPVYLDADSMGCTQALYVAAQRAGSRPVAGLVLKNPPPLRQVVLGRFGWWNLWLAAGPIAAAIPGQLDAIASARRCTAPAIFIRAMNDTLVPPSYQKRIFDAYAGPKYLVDFHDAEHNTPMDEPIEIEVGKALRKLVAGQDPAKQLQGPGLEPRGGTP